MSRVTCAECRAGSRPGDRSRYPQTLADLLVPQVFEVDAEALAVGKLRVVLPLPGKVGIDLDAMADVADQDERRPAMTRGSARA